ncbi:aldehyde dehydrogenase family protein [candidate division KSB3 bacterium]|uniref:Aldehyde dehydrogenase family protein n=1 Tax=candidate division KSB3 bacterium TaxID=2044937 RepID=A0A9D5Q5P9_9BACT|nr:aldehyde dehydrogenase family protein [candidate division KSB3 bacterium]MBD3324477.1 aldehyde dehydrogenase family protein [candidate division KSB3 bacterium]
MDYTLWIDGQWTDGAQGKRMEIENPATLKPFAVVADADPDDVNRAVHAAKTAFYDGRWSGKTPAERAEILWKFADLLQAHAEPLARLESQNTGKPFQALSLAADIPFSIDNLRFFAAAARNTSGSHAGEFIAGHTSIFRREPVGVVAQITPWNYPLMMAIWKIGPALAAGCTTVVKPAPGTPLSTLYLAELSAEAGIPPGVFNIVTGSDQAGQALVEHPDIRMVSVTGATSTGQQVMRTAAATLKRVHLELGGKAPVLVFRDADLEAAATKITLAATFNSGQDCTAATRVYVEQNRLAAMQDALIAAMRRVQVGDPFVDETEMGPLISGVHRDRVHGFVERARAAGATILTGGNAVADLPHGYYYAPTVITQVEQDAEIVQQEVFGPVITLQSFTTEAEAIALANDVDYGLASYLFTTDVGRVMRVSRQLEFGAVFVNEYQLMASETPHGGFKQSGFGKDLSLEALHDYQITKHVLISHDTGA